MQSHVRLGVFFRKSLNLSGRQKKHYLFHKNPFCSGTYASTQCDKQITNHGSHTFSKTIFHTFSILNEKTSNTTNYLNFSKIIFMEHNAIAICNTCHQQ